MDDELAKLISVSNRILISSHIGPDGDSVSSSLLAMSILQFNYPSKQITVSFEEEPYGLDFLEGLKNIKIQHLNDALEKFKPDLFLILDANSISRLTREPVKPRHFLANNKIKVAIIDHHEAVGTDPNDLYINNFSPAVTLDIYELFIEKMKLKKPPGYAQVAMTGIYTDTGGFVNRNFNYSKTFSVLPNLIEDGADIEKIANLINKISDAGFNIFKKFIQNMKLEEDYVFTYLDDGELKGNNQVLLEDLKQAADLIRTSLLRNIGHRAWGFIIYKDLLASRPTYSVSFRALSDTKDVSILAAKLGGGGHKPAAGAKLECQTMEEALARVKAVIAG